MRWKCTHCEHENGPEAAYCTECGEAGPLLQPDAGTAITTIASGSEGRSTLVGSSAGIAPSLLERKPATALMQPLPRSVRLGMAGWVALVGGWPELCLCLLTLPLIAVGVYAGGMLLGGLSSALIGIAGVGLFVVLAFLFGATETTRTLRGLRLARGGWAAGGDVVRKSNRRGRMGATYWLEYTYTDARGVIRHGKQEVTREQWQSFSIHDPVTVLYDPDRPQLCALYELLTLSVVARDPALPSPTDDRQTATEDG